MDQNSCVSKFNDICTKTNGTALESDSLCHLWSCASQTAGIGGVTTSTRMRSDLVAMVRFGAQQLSPSISDSKCHELKAIQYTMYTLIHSSKQKNHIGGMISLHVGPCFDPGHLQPRSSLAATGT